MSWFGSASEWKQGLSSTAMSKVEELESQTEKLKKERLQKQNQLDTLQQALDKQKRKNEEETKLRQSLEKENEHLAQTCELFQSKLHKGGTDSSGLSTDSFNLGTEKVLRKKIQDLENEIKNLQGKFQEGQGKDVTDQMVSQNDPFWRRFSSSGSEGSLPPYKSPAKFISKKALETSDENPFKALAATPHMKGLEISAENPFKTPRKCDSATTLPQAPASTPKTDYTIELEKKLHIALMENEDLKQERNAPTNQTSQDVQICSLKTELEKTKSDHTTQGQQLHSVNDQLVASKTKTEDLEIKVNTLEQRVKLLQTELDCQRQNSETAKHHLEEKLKGKEREFNVEVSRFQKELGASELQLQELSGKLQQQEAFALGNQNSLQSSIDKLTSQLSSVEKEKLLAQNQASQFESSVNQLQKSEDDSKALITQLRQEKEMIKAQVDSLKVKLGDAESLVNRLQSQLASSEQLVINHKVSLEDAVACHKAAIEKEKQSHKMALENVVTEKDKLLKEAKSKISELEVELTTKKDDFVTSQNEKNDAILKLQQTEEDCLQRLAGVIELETKCDKLSISLEEKEKVIENQEKVLRAEYEETKLNLEKEVQRLLMSLETVKEQEKANLREALKKVEVSKEQEFSKLQHKAEEIEERLSLSQKSEEKVRSEKLAVELNIWELEGRIEGLTKAEINLQQQNKELVEKIFQLEDSLRAEKNVAAVKTTEVETLNKNLQETANTLASLVATLEGVKVKLQSSEHTVIEMTKQIDRLKAELCDRESKIKSLNEERLQFDLSLAETKAQYEKLVEESIHRNESNTKTIDDLLKEKEALVLKCESYSAQLASSLEEWLAKEETIKHERQDYEARINTLETEVEALNKKNNELLPLQDTVVELTANQKTLEETATLHDNRTKQLKEMVQNLTDNVMKLEEQKESESHKYKSEIEALIQLNTVLEKQATESASTLTESEKFIKILQDQNESLSQTLIETNENLSQVNTSTESLKENLAQIRYDCEQVTLEKEKFVEQLNRLQKDYDLIKVQLEQSETRLAKQISFSQDKEKECAERTQSLNEVTTAMNHLKERFSALSEENKIEKEELSLKYRLQEDINLGLRQDIVVYEEKIEASESSIEEMKLSLSDKDAQLTDMQKSNADLKEEFDSKLTELNKQIDSLKDEIAAKEEQSIRLENQNAQSVQVCVELRAKLNHQEDVNRCLSLEFEDYKEVANVMRRETISQEETMKEVERLQDLNEAFETKVSGLTKSLIEVQRKNCELSSLSLTKKELKDSKIQVDVSHEGCCSHTQGITKLEKELNERELMVVELGDKIQELFAEVDNLQLEKEDLKKKLNDQEVNASLTENAKHISSGDSIFIEALKDELNQKKLDLQRAQEKSIFNVTLAQDLDEKVESLRNELNLKLTVEKDLRTELDSIRELQQLTVKRGDFEELEGAFCRLKMEHKKLQDELKLTQTQLQSSFPCDKITQKERELSELTQELICENGKLEAKNNDIIKANADLQALKDILNNQVEESLAQNNLYERDIDNLHKKLDEIISENSSFANESRMQTLALKEIEMERSSLVESNKKLLGENTQLIRENEDMKEKHKLLEEDIILCKKDSQKYSCEIESKMKETLKAKSSEINDLVKRSEILEKELEFKDKQIKELIAQNLTRSECVEMQTEESEKQASVLNSRISSLELTLDIKEQQWQTQEQNYLKVQNDMENSFTKLKCEVEDLSLKLDNAFKELNQSKIKEEEWNSALANLTKKLSCREDENRKLKESNLELGEKQKELDSKIKVIDQLELTIANLKSDIGNLTRKSEELQSRGQYLQKEVENKSLLVDEKDETVAKQQKDLLNLTKQLEVSTKHKEALNENLKIKQEELNLAVADLTQKLSCEQEENRKLKESKLELGEKLEELDSKIKIIDQLRSTINNLEFDNANLTRHSEELKSQNQSLQEEAETKSLLMKEKEETVAKQQNDLLNLTKQLEISTKHEEALNENLKIKQEELNLAVADLTQKLSCEQEENRKLKESKLELGEKLEELDSKIKIIDQLRSTINNLEFDNANLTRHSEELKSQNQSVQEEAETKSLLMKEKEETVAKQQNDLLNLTKQLEISTKHEEALNENLKIKQEELNLAVADLTQKLSCEQEENRKLKESKLELGEKLEELDSKIKIIDQLRSTINNLEFDNANLNRHSEELKSQNQSLQEEAETKSLLMKEKEETVAKQQNDLLNLTKQLEISTKHEEALNENLKIKQEELNLAVADLTQKLSCEQEENRKLKVSNLELGEKLEELDSKIKIIDQLRSTINNLEFNIANLTRQSEELKSQNQSLQEEAETKSLLMKEKEETVAKQQNDLLNLTKQLEISTKHEEALNENLKIKQEELNLAVADLTQKLSCEQEENRKLKESNLELGEKLEELDSKIKIIDQLRSTINNLEFNIANLTRQSEELKSQNQSLQEEAETKSLLMKEKEETVAKQQNDLLNLTKQLEISTKHEEALNENLKIKQEELNLAVADLTQKLSCEQEENRKLKESKLELGEKLEELDSKIKIIDQLECTVTNLTRQSDQLRKQNQCLQEDVESKLLLGKEKDEMVARQQNDLLNLSKQLETSSKKEKDLNDNLNSMEAFKSQLITKLEDLTKVKTQIESCLSAANKKIKVAEKEIADLKDTKAAIIEENVGLNMLKTELLMKIENLDQSEQEQSRKWKEEVQTIRSSLDTAETSLQHTRKEEEKLGNILKSKDIQIQELKSCIKRTIVIMLKMKGNLEGITLIVSKKSVLNVKDDSCQESCSKEYQLTPSENSSELEMLCQELIAKLSNIQSYCKELKEQIESLRGDVSEKEEMLSERKIQLDAIQKELIEVKDEMGKEQHNLKNECAENDILNETIKKKDVQLKDCSKHVKDAEADLAKLKAKFITMQTSAHNKDKELAKAHTAISKLERDDKKMKNKLKEIHLESKEKESNLAGAMKEIKEWERKFNEKSTRLHELEEICLQSEKTSQSLHEKVSKLQLRNKQLQSDLSAKRRATKAPQLLQDSSSSLSKDSQQTTDIVDCSQSQDNTCDVNLVASIRKGVTRRAAMMGQTSNDVTSTKMCRRGPNRKPLLKASVSNQEKPQDCTPSDQEPSSLDFHSTRRITRSFYSEKRVHASSGEEFSTKKMKLGDWEGLPDKVRKGLNDIPGGGQSPGIITRPTTPLKRTSRGPLKIIDPNFERSKNSTSSSAKMSEPPSNSTSGLPKDPVEVEIPSKTDNNTEADKRDLVSRSSIPNPKSGALRNRNKLRNSSNADDCKAQ